MKILGCDLQAKQQAIAIVDTETGKFTEKTPAHEGEPGARVLRCLQLQKRIQELDRQVEEEAKQRPQTLRLLTHPGVGPITALATEVFLADAHRFAHGNN